VKLIIRKIALYIAIFAGFLISFILFIQFGWFYYFFGFNPPFFDKYVFLFLGISFGLLIPEFIFEAIEYDIDGRFTIDPWRFVIGFIAITIGWIFLFFWELFNIY